MASNKIVLNDPMVKMVKMGPHWFECFFIGPVGWPLTVFTFSCFQSARMLCFNGSETLKIFILGDTFEVQNSF